MLQKARTLNTHVIFRKGTGNWELAVGTSQRNRVLICKDECRYEAAPNAFRMPPATHRESSRSKEGMRRLPLPPLIFFKKNNPASSLHLHPVSSRLRCAAPQDAREQWMLAAAFSRSLGGARTGGNEKGCSELTSLRRLCFLSPIIKGLAAPGLDSDFRGNPSRLFLPWPSIALPIVQVKQNSVANNYPVCIRTLV